MRKEYAKEARRVLEHDTHEFKLGRLPKFIDAIVSRLEAELKVDGDLEKDPAEAIVNQLLAPSNAAPNGAGLNANTPLTAIVDDAAEKVADWTERCAEVRNEYLRKKVQIWRAYAKFAELLDGQTIMSETAKSKPTYTDLWDVGKEQWQTDAELYAVRVMREGTPRFDVDTSVDPAAMLDLPKQLHNQTKHTAKLKLMSTRDDRGNSVHLPSLATLVRGHFDVRREEDGGRSKDDSTYRAEVTVSAHKSQAHYEVSFEPKFPDVFWPGHDAPLSCDLHLTLQGVPLAGSPIPIRLYQKEAVFTKGDPDSPSRRAGSSVVASSSALPAAPPPQPAAAAAAGDDIPVAPPPPPVAGDDGEGELVATEASNVMTE